MIGGAAALLAVGFRHGEEPRFGIGWRELAQDEAPYPVWWPDWHSGYSSGMALLLSVLCVSATTRRATTQPERGWWVLLCCVVSIFLLWLQLAGTVLVYSVRYTDQPETGPGLWLPITCICIALCK